MRFGAGVQRIDFRKEQHGFGRLDEVAISGATLQNLLPQSDTGIPACSASAFLPSSALFSASQRLCVILDPSGSGFPLLCALSGSVLIQRGDNFFFAWFLCDLLSLSEIIEERE